MPRQCVWAVNGKWQQNVTGPSAVQAERMEGDLDAELEALELELAITRCEDLHVRCTPSQHVWFRQSAHPCLRCIDQS